MNLLQIEYFMSIAESGSFRQTAEKMYVSQPAVSKQISLLEKELNVILFNRKYRSATLTKAGSIMYEYFRDAKENYNESWKKARLADKRASSELRIGIMEHTIIPGFSEACMLFNKKYPSVFLSLCSAPIYRLTLEQSDGPFDIVINHSPHFLNHESLEYFKLFEGFFILAFPKDHPLLNSNPLDPEELKKEHYFISATSDFNTTIDGALPVFRELGLSNPDFLMQPNLESVILAVRSGLGLALLDSTVRLPDDGSIVSVPLKNKLDYMIAWRKDNDNIAINFFTDMVRKTVSKY